MQLKYTYIIIINLTNWWRKLHSSWNQSLHKSSLTSWKYSCQIWTGFFVSEAFFLLSCIYLCIIYFYFCYFAVRSSRPCSTKRVTWRELRCHGVRLWLVTWYIRKWRIRKHIWSMYIITTLIWNKNLSRDNLTRHNEIHRRVVDSSSHLFREQGHLCYLLYFFKQCLVENH